MTTPDQQKAYLANRAENHKENLESLTKEEILNFYPAILANKDAAAIYLASQVEALTKERDALKEDAERYRWLRGQHWQENTLAVVLRPKDNTKLGCFLPFDELLDMAIDKARGNPA